MSYEKDARKHNTNCDTIEALIDRYGLSYVIDLVAEVCSAKADHLRAAWQDESTGDVWDAQAERLCTVSYKASLALGGNDNELR